jgi:hypothetical protein
VTPYDFDCEHNEETESHANVRTAFEDSNDLIFKKFEAKEEKRVKPKTPTG